MAKPLLKIQAAPKSVVPPVTGLKRSNAAKKGVAQAFPSKAQIKKTAAAKAPAKTPAKRPAKTVAKTVAKTAVKAAVKAVAKKPAAKKAAASSA